MEQSEGLVQSSMNDKDGEIFKCWRGEEERERERERTRSGKEGRVGSDASKGEREERRVKRKLTSGRRKFSLQQRRLGSFPNRRRKKGGIWGKRKRFSPVSPGRDASSDSKKTTLGRREGDGTYDGS